MFSVWVFKTVFKDLGFQLRFLTGVLRLLVSVLVMVLNNKQTEVRTSFSETSFDPCVCTHVGIL